MVESDTIAHSTHKSRGKGTKWIFRQLCIVPQEAERKTTSKSVDISTRKSPRRSMSCSDVSMSKKSAKPTSKSLHNSHDGFVLRKSESKGTSLSQSSSQCEGRFSGFEQLPSPPTSIISFEVELMRVLNHKDCAIIFRKWCQAHHCEENMEFWIDVEILKQRAEQGEDYKKHSEAIYSKYLDARAPFPINVDYDLTQKMGQTLKSGSRLSVEDYVAAQESVFRLMENGCINRFLDSDQYKQWRESMNSSKRKKMLSKRNQRLSNQTRTASQGTINIELLFSKVGK